MHHGASIDDCSGKDRGVLSVDVKQRERREEDLACVVAHETDHVLGESKVGVVCQHDTLRRACGARCEQDDRYIVWGDFGGRRNVSSGSHKFVEGVRSQPLRSRTGVAHDDQMLQSRQIRCDPFDAIGPFGVDDQCTAFGLVQQVGEQVTFVAGVDRDLDDTGLRHTDPGRQELWAVFQHDRGFVALAEAEIQEPVPETIC